MDIFKVRINISSDLVCILADGIKIDDHNNLLFYDEQGYYIRGYASGQWLEFNKAITEDKNTSDFDGAGIS